MIARSLTPAAAALGDRLTILQQGVVVNVGTLDRPVWQKQT